MKSTIRPVKGKNEARKAKKEGRRESETAVTFKPKNVLQNFAFCPCLNFAS